MLTLAATNTLSGIASVASQMTCTIMGMELVGTTETYKVLYQGQLGATASTLYTVGASTTTFVKSILITNNDSATRTFRLFVNGTANSNAITSIFEVPAGGSATYEDGNGWEFYTSNGIILGGAVPLNMFDSAFFVSGCKAETFPRHLVPEVNTSALATGRLTLEAITLRQGDVLTSIRFWSATTAAGTPTNQIFGIYDANLNLVANTSNDTTTAWAANARKTLSLTSSYTVPSTGLYYLGIMVTATTVPTLKGMTAVTGGQLRGATPNLGGTSSTGLTTSLPNPAAAITVSTAPIWGCVN